MTYVGSNSRLNTVIGVTEIISLTIGLETEYSNKIFKANLILKKESTGLLYITDGVTQLSALPSVTDEVATYLNQHIADNTIHITPELTEQLNNATVNVNRLSRVVDDISTNLDSHINNADLHVSAATIASTYATKDEIDGYATSDDLNDISALISITYATKDELTEHVNNAGDTYATKTELSNAETSISDHTANNEIHLTSEDRILLQSIGNNTQLQSYELDDVITSLYS